MGLTALTAPLLPLLLLVLAQASLSDRLVIELQTREDFTITEKAPTRAKVIRDGHLVSKVSYSRPSVMIIALRTQFHVERPWGQRPFSIVS